MGREQSVTNWATSLWNPGKKMQTIDCLSDLPVTAVDSIRSANPTNVLIVGPLEGAKLKSSEIDQLKEFVFGGGQVLMLHPENSLISLSLTR